MRTIAIMNNKGGVGKTATTINLADSLVHDHHKRVAIVDCDGQANATHFFLPKFKSDDGVTICDIMQGRGETVWSDNFETVRAGLTILPGDSALYMMDIASIRDGADKRAMRCLVDIRNAAEEDGETDFMLFDCPPGYTTASVSALYAADEVIIPMLMDAFAFEGLRSILNQIELLRKDNPRLRVSGALITQWHRCDSVEQGEALLHKSRVPILQTVIRRSEKLVESTYERTPIREYSPGSGASQDYRRLARELLGKEI
ncbi:ParA family protein [Oscillibacter valericigenes]|nr:ParA family protein [Oscillibacter valericigenes]